MEDAGGPGPAMTVALPTPVVDLPLFTWPAAVMVPVPAPAVVRPFTEGSYLRKSEIFSIPNSFCRFGKEYVGKCTTSHSPLMLIPNI